LEAQMRVQLSGQMPGEETNGFTPRGKEFWDDPLKLVPVLAMVAITKKVEKTETGEQQVVARFHHIEVCPERHQQVFAGMLGDALGDRTGAAFLPFGIGEQAPMKEEPFPEEEVEEPIEITRPRRSGTRKPRRAAAQADDAEPGYSQDDAAALDTRSDEEREAF
jgi:hypothetical protein